MCRPKTNRAARLTAGTVATVGVALWLAGCSDIYWDRRETIALGAGDDLAANTMEQMVDPWPAYSGDKNIPFNGQKMEAAVARYRNGKVIDPPDPESGTTNNQSGQTINQTTVNTGGSSPAAGASTPGQ